MIDALIDIVYVLVVYFSMTRGFDAPDWAGFATVILLLPILAIDRRVRRSLR